MAGNPLALVVPCDLELSLLLDGRCRCILHSNNHWHTAVPSTSNVARSNKMRFWLYQFGLQTVRITNRLDISHFTSVTVGTCSDIRALYHPRYHVLYVKKIWRGAQ
jgi:hypothetical protein